MMVIMFCVKFPFYHNHHVSRRVFIVHDAVPRSREGWTDEEIILRLPGPRQVKYMLKYTLQIVRNILFLINDIIIYLVIFKLTPLHTYFKITYFKTVWLVPHLSKGAMEEVKLYDSCLLLTRCLWLQFTRCPVFLCFLTLHIIIYNLQCNKYKYVTST